MARPARLWKMIGLAEGKVVVAWWEVEVTYLAMGAKEAKWTSTSWSGRVRRAWAVARWTFAWPCSELVRRRTRLGDIVCVLGLGWCWEDGGFG